MVKPLVSVIIPVYNSSKTIINCLRSVLQQTYSNIEILVVDDGSIDETVCLIREQIVDSRLILILQENKGPSSARNHGISLAKGKYIAFLDSDDEWLPNKLEKQMELCLSIDNALLIGTAFYIGNARNMKLGNKLKEYTPITLQKLLLKNYFITSTVLCKKEVFEIFSFNEKQKYSEDYRLWLQILTLDGNCLLMHTPLTKMSDKPIWGAKVGLSSRIWRMEKGELSNYIYLYKKEDISILQLVYSLSFSFVKYIVRFLIYSMRIFLIRAD